MHRASGPPRLLQDPGGETEAGGKRLAQGHVPAAPTGPELGTPPTWRPPPASACGDICQRGLVRSRHPQACELRGLELPSRGPGSRTFSPLRCHRVSVHASCQVQTPGRGSQIQPETTPQTASQSQGLWRKQDRWGPGVLLGEEEPLACSPGPPASPRCRPAAFVEKKKKKKVIIAHSTTCFQILQGCLQAHRGLMRLGTSIS